MPAFFIIFKLVSSSSCLQKQREIQTMILEWINIAPFQLLYRVDPVFTLDFLFLIQHNNCFGLQLKLLASIKLSYTFDRYWIGADQFKISTETLLKR